MQEKLFSGLSKTFSMIGKALDAASTGPVSYTHLRAHEPHEHLVCRLLLEKNNTTPFL